MEDVSSSRGTEVMRPECDAPYIYVCEDAEEGALLAESVFADESIGCALLLWQRGGFPRGFDAVEFAFVGRSENFMSGGQERVLENALEFLDIDARMRSGSVYIKGERCSNAVRKSCAGRTMFAGTLLLRGGHDGLTPLCAFNPTLSPSFLIGAVRYAYECSYGKCRLADTETVCGAAAAER